MGEQLLLAITVAPGEWGDFKNEDVKFLLSNVAQHFLKHFDTRSFIRLRVHCKAHLLSGKVECPRWWNPGHEHRITLCTSDFCQWSFQFTHELCHIVSNYDRMHYKENLWFQEALCDLASFFTLRQLAASCREPHPSNWTWFSNAIQNYARTIVDRDEFKLQTNISFPAWFAANEPSLRVDRYQRAKNGLIALQLLPIVEKNPENWASIGYLPDFRREFARFLAEWGLRCLENQRAFVSQISRAFGVSIGP